MNIKEIAERNYAANVKRGQITDSTYSEAFVLKLGEELSELNNSIERTRGTLSFDEKELADVALVCFAMAQHYGIDLLKVMEEKMLFNETRED